MFVHIIIRSHFSFTITIENQNHQLSSSFALIISSINTTTVIINCSGIFQLSNSPNLSNCHSYVLLSCIRSRKSSSCVSYAIPCNIMQCLFFLDLCDFGKQFIRISRPVSGIFELSSNPSQTGLEIPPNTVDIHQTYIKNILLLLDQMQQTRSKHTSNIHRKYFASSEPVALEVGTIKTTSS